MMRPIIINRRASKLSPGGTPPLALQHLETSLEEVMESGTEHQLALCRIALAEVLLEMDDHEAAELRLTEALQCNQTMRSHLLHYMICLVRARLCMKSGLAARGREYPMLLN